MLYEKYGCDTQTPLGIITVPLPQDYHVIRLLSFDFAAMEVVFEVVKGVMRPEEIEYVPIKYRVAFRDVEWGLEHRLERIEHALRHISLINQILK